MSKKDQEDRESGEAIEQEPDRLAEPVSTEQPPRLPFVVVGIGASAGGLEAFIDFFSTVPADTGMAFVIVQHLPPDRESMLAEILSRKTSLPVKQVEDSMAVRPNHVYVIRPGHTLKIQGGALRLGPRLKEPNNNRPVDDFFRSLAEEQRERSVCVVLSGMGSNGTAGAQAVKVVGGICIAQDPDTAIQPSMPRSLINAGYADYILRANEMAEVLIQYAKHPYIAGDSEVQNRKIDAQIIEVLNILRTRTKRDFSPYKRPTIHRRIQRRMGVTRQQTIEEYARFLRQNPMEASALADDLLIHVTGFFRDPEAWEYLRQRVIAPLVAERPNGSEIRCWVAACSSGEESYSLAMLLTEAAEQAEKNLDIKVFATDTAQRTLAHARNGLYPGGIETEISPARLERFFDRDASLYRVKKELRERVIFAPQNLVEDPPFSRLDIITCRNLLIYLEPEIQRRILAMLHFGLREGGTLFLGTSETVTACEDMFDPIDRKWRIFRRIGPPRHGAFQFLLPRDFSRLSGGETGASTRQQASLSQLTHQAMLQRHTPAAVVVDREYRIVFYHGNTSTFLAQPSGEPTRDLLSTVREEVRGAVRNALHQAIADKGFARVRDGIILTEHGRMQIDVTVEPLDLRAPMGNLLVSFIERELPPPASPEGHVHSPGPQDQLVEELQRTKDELQSTVEELQSSNEELKASNEEVTSVNEELQSTNEELETSKEEMQSLNEELSTVNSQLHAKNEELERTGNDLASLLSSTNIAVIFLDTDYHIRRFTPAVRDLMDLLPSDIGRPLRDLNRKFSDDNLLPDAAQVLERLVPVEKEIQSESGRHYLRRILPYRTVDNRINGTVITFVDVTDRKKFEEELSRAKLHAERANQSKDRFLAMLSHELRTPLTPVVLALSEFEGHKELPAELRGNLEMIRRNLAMETRLIDDLLDLSRVISGKLRLKRKPVGVHKVLSHALQTIATDFNGKKIQVNLHLDAREDTILADESRLQQVFLNILHNAMKFTLVSGAVTIRTRNDHDFIVMQLQDNGIGIDPSFLNQIFEPFEQGSPSRQNGGLGLGLAITRSITELHGGRISVSSEGKGKGANFTIQFPLLPANQRVALEEAASKEATIRKKADKIAPTSQRLLLVEDHADTALLLVRLLKMSGYSVRHAGAIAAALQMAAEETPTIVISDLNLPDGSGFDLMRQLRQSYAIKGVVISGFGTEDDIRHSIEAGFAEHITKPIHFPDLLEAIEKLAAS